MEVVRIYFFTFPVGTETDFELSQYLADKYSMF